MRLRARVVLAAALAASVASVACGSKRSGGYSPGGPGVGGAGNTSGNGGTGSSGNGGSGGGGGGSGGSGNFGGGGPGCDGTKSPSEDACVIHETYAVFVSPTGDDIEGDGSRGKPYKSMEVALSSAVAKKKRVYACATAGPFEGLITLDSFADGVSLYGGFDCSKWDYKSGARTELNGPAAGVISIQGLTQGTTLEDFTVTAQSATSAGGSSVGIVIGSSSNVTLRRLKVSAGAGAPGVVGYTTPGMGTAGQLGEAGKNACGASVLGGKEVMTGCGFPESVGAFGGDGGFGTAKPTDGLEGEPHLGGGAGGLGQDDTLPGGWSCGTNGGGKDGKPGSDGSHGAGSQSAGSLTASGWVPSAGAFGQNGGNGQGGGGGGGAKAPSSCGVSAPLRGASGGSGGSGGCGGIGGEGGKGGGASIALASFQSQVTLDAVELVASGGGSGGAGGVGQIGGNGANGAGGGTGACAGGNGAKGGNGGHGGGGAGGPSIGLAYKGQKPVRTGGSIKVSSTPAAGGADGVGQTTGPGVGALGLIEPEHEF